MIVPRIHMIVGAAIVLLPVSLLAARPEPINGVIWMVLAFLVCAAAADAAFGHRRFADISIGVTPMVRMTVGKPSVIPITLNKPQGIRLKLRIGPALPLRIDSHQTIYDTVMRQGDESLRLRWPCIARRRGRYSLTGCHIEVPSRWGFWSVRRRFSVNCEIRVYPNLATGQQHLLGIFHRRELGWRTMRRLGKGREFEQLRDYLPGDSYEDVDWKATARRLYPVTRVYQVEQSQEIYVVLDASLLSTRNAGFGRERRRRRKIKASNHGEYDTIFERYVKAALVMALAAERASDRYGLMIFGSRPDCIIKAGRGRAHYNACREALYNRHAQLVSPDYNELFTFIGTHLRKRSLLVFLTNLDDPLLSETFINAMRTCARQHVLLVNMFRPAGAYPLFSSPQVYHERGIYEHLTGHMVWSSLSTTRRQLKQYGAGFTLLDNELLFSQLVNQYMEVKQKQIL